MGRLRYPKGKPCRCGCRKPAARLLGKDGRNRGWAKYAKGHQPPPPLCDPKVRRKAAISKLAAIPFFTRRKVRVGELWYWVIKVPGQGRWPLEHRYIMEQRLGRKLRTNEHVHHSDGDGLNNDPDNLLVMTASEHRRQHNNANPLPRCVCTCPHCGAISDHFRKLS